MAKNSTDSPNLVMIVTAINVPHIDPPSMLTLKVEGGLENPKQDPKGYGIVMDVAGTITFSLSVQGEPSPSWIFPDSCPAITSPLTAGNYYGINFSVVTADITAVTRLDDHTVAVSVNPNPPAGPSYYAVQVTDGAGHFISTDDPAIKDSTQ